MNYFDTIIPLFTPCECVKGVTSLFNEGINVYMCGEVDVTSAPLPHQTRLCLEALSCSHTDSDREALFCSFLGAVWYLYVLYKQWKNVTVGVI